MTVPQKVTSELQSVAPSAIIELFELTLATALHGSNSTYRFHAGVNGKNDGGAIIWNANTFTAYPVEADGFEYNGQGQLPRPRIRVSNQLGLITAILLAVNAASPGNDLVGATVTRIRVLAKHIDAANFPGNTNPYGTPDPTAELPREVYYIARKTVEARDLVEFELASAFDLAGISAPRRLCIANMCNWVYRSAECGYIGNAYFNDSDQPVSTLGEDVCSKRLAGCEARFAPVSIDATVTSGSATMSGLSSTELSKISTGDPIYGFGVPQGTTIASKGTSSLTMSQAATANSTRTVTGTLNATGTAITVSSATGLLPGMTVTGANIPAGTTISSISGTTVTLSISYNPFTRGSSETRSVTVQKYPLGFELWMLSNTSGITVGDLAGNTVGITTTKPQGTNVYADTKVSSIVANSSVTLNKRSQFSHGNTFTAIFWRPVTFTSSSYTFSASTRYTIRADKSLPFGSFPGVGGFYA
jgi:lambda family phage minor tail protein L